MEIKTGSVLDHPNPKLRKAFHGKHNLHKKYKDHRGMLVLMEAFEKEEKHGKLAWIAQYTTWMRSETKLAEPLFLINVPVTSFQVHNDMPFRAYSTEEIEAKIRIIDQQWEEWVTMEWYQGIT